MRELPPRARWYILTVSALALAVVAVSATRVTAWADVAAFAVLYGLATYFVTVTANNLSMSVGFIVALASVAVLVPWRPFTSTPYRCPK